MTGSACPFSTLTMRSQSLEHMAPNSLEIEPSLRGSFARLLPLLLTRLNGGDRDAEI